MPWPLAMILRIAPYLLVAYLYVGWRTSSALVTLTQWPAWSTRLGVLLLIAAGNLLPLAIFAGYRRGDGNNFFMQQPHLTWQDFAFNFPFWMGLIIVVESLAYLLAMDLISGILRFLPRYASSWPPLKAALTLLLLVFLAIYVPLRLYHDSYQVRKTVYEVPVRGLPESLKGLRLGFLSDVQVDRYTGAAKLARTEKVLADISPEILLFAGDLVTSGQRYIQAGLNFMASLPAAYRRIACMGDHDYWANPGRIRTGLRKGGWAFLENQHEVVNYHGADILITGVTYIYSVKTPAQTLRNLFEQAPEAQLKILLVHQPAERVLALAREYGYHLVLAGHTHGGQVVFRPFGFSLTPTRFESKFYQGLNDDQGLPVIVTNGVGRTLAPIRYQAPAEVVDISLVPSNN